MVSSQSEVSLREVTAENVRALCKLSVGEKQKSYVVTNAIAIAEASYFPEQRLQAIYAAETPAGLVVLKVQPEKSSYFLWRLMIDARYQGYGIGHRAMGLLIKHVNTDANCKEFLTSIVLGELSPQSFYESLGFELTGNHYEGEAIMRLTL